MDWEAFDRHRTRRKLSDLEERYRALFDHSRDCVFLVTLMGRFIDANDALLKLLGYTADEIPNITLEKLLKPEDVSRARARLMEALKDDTSGGEYCIRRKDGSEVEVEISASAVLSEGAPYAIQGIARDITRRKAAERTLRESEQRFRALVEQSIAGAYMIQEGKFVYVNPRLAQIFGYATPEEIIGLTPLDLTAERDRATVAENVRRRLAGEVPTLAYTFTGLRKGGAEIQVGVHGTVIVLSDRPTIIGLLQDITGRREARP